MIKKMQLELISLIGSLDSIAIYRPLDEIILFLFTGSPGGTRDHIMKFQEFMCITRIWM